MERRKGRRRIPVSKGLSWSETKQTSPDVQVWCLMCGGGSEALGAAKFSVYGHGRHGFQAPPCPQRFPSHCAVWKTTWLANGPV